MNTLIRRKLAMASRVRDFCRTHPSTSEGFTQALAKLEERLARAEELLAQQGTGFVTRRASTKVKRELRKTIRENHLRHLVRIARGSEGEITDLPKRFWLPAASLNSATFLASAKVMAEQAANYKDLFIRDGMPATFLEDLHTILAEYEGAVNGQFAGAALHIGAKADAAAISKELMGLVKRLDGIILVQFENEPELKAAWRAAKDVSWPKVSEGGEGLKPAA